VPTQTIQYKEPLTPWLELRYQSK